MNVEQAEHSSWRYFKRDSCTGAVYEIYRCPANGKSIEDQEMEDVQLLLSDGSWRKNRYFRIVDEILTGKFSEEDDEITEEEAMDYYRKWKRGKWPGGK